MTNQASEVLQGDCLETMKRMPDDSIDAVITDPPYGYSFMGKDWDKAVPSVEIWQECLRVLKPGAFICVMSAPRSDVQSAMISRLMEAGFRLDFTPIYWTYATGFPKAGNIGKLVDKRLGAEREVIAEVEPFGREGRSGKGKAKFEVDGWETDTKVKVTAPATPQAKALDGSYAGFQPKPAVEVVIIAMKPLSEKTYVDQALKNGKGITWLDDVRIPYQDQADIDFARSTSSHKNSTERPDTEHTVRPGTTRPLNWEPASGRFPANLLVSDDVLNDGVERKDTHKHEIRSFNSSERSGDGFLDGLTSSGLKTARKSISDSGSYSRYFDLDKWAAAHLTEQQMKTFPFAIFPKASKSEKNKGLEHLPASTDALMATMPLNGDGSPRNKLPQSNFHPTVKPLKLMSYLITLFSREGDTVLDPFVGSGTTVVAAEQLGRKGIGIEREAEYAEIARARVEHAKTKLEAEL